MIDIKSDKEKVIRSLQELEFEFAQGNVLEKAYNSQKRELTSKLETLEVADRVKRLQGKGEAEKPLEYWTEKKEAEEAKQAKEELMKKFITSSSPSYPKAKKGTNRNQRKAVIYTVLALIFVSGIGFGVFLMKIPGESAAVTMTINQSAFPVVSNDTNVTNTTSSNSTGQSSSTSSSRTTTSSTNNPSTGGNTPTTPTTPSNPTNGT
jgi:Fe2+ transport system protein B